MFKVHVDAIADYMNFTEVHLISQLCTFSHLNVLQKVCMQWHFVLFV